MLNKKTTIQVSQKCKNFLDTFRTPERDTYEDVIMYLIQEVAGDTELKKECLYIASKGDCRALFVIEWNENGDGILSFLNSYNEECDIDELKKNPQDTEGYDEFIRIIELIIESDLDLIDYSAMLNTGESITVTGLSILRVS